MDNRAKYNRTPEKGKCQLFPRYSSVTDTIPKPNDIIQTKVLQKHNCQSRTRLYCGFKLFFVLLSLYIIFSYTNVLIRSVTYLRQNECTIQTYIPLWLIGTGCYGIFAGILLIIVTIQHATKQTCDPNHVFKIAFNSIFSVFLGAMFASWMIWTVIGDLWIFSIYKIVHHNATDIINVDNYCNKDCYLLAFSLAIGLTTAVGFGILVSICFLVCIIFIK